MPNCDLPNAALTTAQPWGAANDAPDVIQICPWFLKYAISKKTKLLTELKARRLPSWVNNIGLDRVVTLFKYTPIDLFMLFEKVMVHEVRPMCSLSSPLLAKLLTLTSLQLAHTRRGGEAQDTPDYWDGYGMYEAAHEKRTLGSSW